MPKMIDIRDAEVMHKTLLCIEDSETEFGLFCAGAHAMLLSLLGDFISRQKMYRLDVKKDFGMYCGVADCIYDWFDTVKRKQAVEEEVLKLNHQIGGKILSLVRKSREKEGRKLWEEEEEGE